MQANFSGVDFFGTALKFLFTSSVKRETRFSCRSRAVMAKKCTKSVMHVQTSCFARLSQMSFSDISQFLYVSISKLFQPAADETCIQFDGQSGVLFWFNLKQLGEIPGPRPLVTTLIFQSIIKHVMVTPITAEFACNVHVVTYSSNVYVNQMNPDIKI